MNCQTFRLTRMLVCLALVGGTTLLGDSCGRAQTAEDLAKAFRHAHDRRDVKAMLTLFCWDRVTPEIRTQTEDQLRNTLDQSILNVAIGPISPGQRDPEYVLDGVTYRFNLPKVAELVVSYPPPNPGATVEDRYSLGKKNGRYLIILAAPVEPGIVSRFPVPEKRSVETNGIARTQPVTIPKGTKLVVRLSQDVGLSAMGDGDTFRATIDEPVMANGVVAIPKGAPVEGGVTRKGELSPEIFLTSVTINGTKYRLDTISSIFNERLTFPAGSQYAFELNRPLELSK